jgi:hypothetical protein
MPCDGVPLILSFLRNLNGCSPTKRLSEISLVYLEKQGFKPDGAALTSKNFKETMALVAGESEQYNDVPENEGTQSGAPMRPVRPQEIRPQLFNPSDQGVAWPQPRIVMSGNRLDIQASVDLEGLKKLQEMLSKYEAILEMADEIPPMGNMEKVGGVWKPKGQ